MIELLNALAEEKDSGCEYPDERIFSNLAYTSYSVSMRQLAGRTEREKEADSEKNQWLTYWIPEASNIPILNVDRIKEKVDQNKCSCDGLFYNFDADADSLHFLIELKNANKSSILPMLDNKENEGYIGDKVKDTVEMIKTTIRFGGTQEDEDLVHHLHFVLIYNGKNDIPSRSFINPIPSKQKVERDAHGKQRRASRKFNLYPLKDEDPIYNRFGEVVCKLGLSPAEESYFPKRATPEAIRYGGKRQRQFTLLTAHDFAEAIESCGLDKWNWGEYINYL